MALDHADGQFPDGGVWTIGASATTVTVPVGATLVYAQTVHATAAVTFDPTSQGNVTLSVSSSSGTLVWAGPAHGGRRTFDLISDTASTPVHLVMYSGRP